MFNFELYKSNKKSLFITIILIALLIILNVLANKTQLLNNRLGYASSNVNKLVINEIMTSNKGALIDENGNNYDWIELYNGYNYDIDLTNYGLSDETNGKIKWAFPAITIKSKSYLIVYLSGKQEEGLFANFSLSREGGELLTLKDSKQNVVDSVKTLSIEKNTSMARDSKGKWIVTSEITPNYENSEDGRNQFLSNLINSEMESDIIITEFLPSNEGNIIFENDKLYSYVEVTNKGNDTINLNDYYLSNDSNVIYKWRFPNVELNSGDSYLIYTNRLDKDNNASFDLKNKAGSLILSSYEGIIEQVDYDQLTNGVAYIKRNNKWFETADISPRYANNDYGRKNFIENLDISKGDLIISEVMGSNNAFLPQNGNQYYDWIELYNNSNENINLSNYSLTNNKDDKEKYVLPDIVLAPNTYFIIMASGDTSLSNSTYNHLNFKLSSGKGLFLYKNNELVDSLFIYNVPSGSSYGRGIDKGHFYYDTPTPGSENINGIIDISYNPEFSLQGGIYNIEDSINLTLEGQGEIYYTLDGSEPTNKSIKYASPIVITKTTVVRAVSYENNKKNSDIITNSYIVNEGHTLPVMSLSMNEQKFNSVQASGYGKTMTKAHAELYEENSFFTIDCDFKLFGGESRTYPKKSFALKFNYEHLKYKVFDDKEIYEFNTLVLRSGSQDQYSAMMRDEFATSIASKYGTLDVQAYKPIVLYINGNYWGIYYIREKIEDDFIERSYNVASKTSIVSSDYIAEEGSNSSVVGLKNYVASHNMRNNENYDYVSSLLDIENYIDYWVYQFIVNNTDVHNVRYYSNPSISSNKVRMILYDLDYTLQSNYGSYYLNFIQYPTGVFGAIDNSILSNLMKNTKFKNKFIDRIAYYLNNVWTQENINSEFSLIYNAIKPEMERNCIRWNLNYNNWNNNALGLKEYSLNRINNVIAITKEYFNLSEEEFNEYLNK